MGITVFEFTRRHIREHLNLPRRRHANVKCRKIGVGVGVVVVVVVVVALRTAI